MQEPPLQAGRECSRVRTSSTFHQRDVPTVPNAAQGERRRALALTRVCLGAVRWHRAMNPFITQSLDCFPLKGCERPEGHPNDVDPVAKSPTEVLSICRLPAVPTPSALHEPSIVRALGTSRHLRLPAGAVEGAQDFQTRLHPLAQIHDSSRSIVIRGLRHHRSP